MAKQISLWSMQKKAMNVFFFWFPKNPSKFNDHILFSFFRLFVSPRTKTKTHGQLKQWWWWSKMKKKKNLKQKTIPTNKHQWMDKEGFQRNFTIWGIIIITCILHKTHTHTHTILIKNNKMTAKIKVNIVECKRV